MGLNRFLPVPVNIPFYLYYLVLLFLIFCKVFFLTMKIIFYRNLKYEIRKL